MNRKPILKKLINITAAITVILPLITSAAPVYAASASLYLSPAASSVAKGAYLTVSVRENSGAEPVNAAQANLSYPANLLSFVSISSSAAFSIVAQNSGGAGSVQIGRGALPAVSGTQTIASVTFKALTNTGSAAVSIAGGSSVVSANSNANIASGLSGGNYTLTNPPAAAPAAPAAPKDTTPPTITAVKVSDITATSATINWTTSEPATTEISYGPSKNYGLAAVETNSGTAHKLALSSPLVQPGITYHFIIKNTDVAGNSTTSPDATFTTTGANLVLTVTNQQKKPLSGARVEVESQSATTNSKGVANLTGLTVGKKYGVVTFRGDKYPFTADIVSADKPTQASAQLKIKPDYTLPVIFLVILLLIVDYFIGWKTGKGGLALASIGKIRAKLPFLGDKNGPGNGPPAGNPTPSAPSTIIKPGPRS